ncbi:hypothetical protein AB6A40_002955 [Gnathostoma spinigerum]|uniref:Globin family profile domain-containing protein n=1 Tax=Gnathostoma spinigerum TaxID=75299 RepID=A0ABD6EAM3_9BILA
MIAAARIVSNRHQKRRKSQAERKISTSETQKEHHHQTSQSDQRQKHHQRNTDNGAEGVPSVSQPPPTRILGLSVARRRAGSAPPIQPDTLGGVWNLRPEQVLALRVTWSRLRDVPRSNCRGIIAIIDNVFSKFDEKDKNLREVFFNAAFVNGMTFSKGRRKSAQSIATLRDHTHFYVSLISQIIQALDSPPEDIFNHIDKIANYHAYLKRYGFKADMWDTLGELLVDAIVVQDCVRCFPDACHAWTTLVASMTDRLHAGRAALAAPTTSSDWPPREHCPTPSPSPSSCSSRRHSGGMGSDLALSVRPPRNRKKSSPVCRVCYDSKLLYE